MAITLADFTKIWASSSPLTPYTFTDPNYAEGWNFVGSTPPARQMWDSIQKNNDEKMKYIVDNFLPSSGGTMTGAVVGNPLTFTADDGNGNSASLVLNPNGSATWNIKEVERVNASGSGYVRYESGLQICWNRVSSVTTSGAVETFPVAFNYVPRISVSTATNAVAIGFASLSTTGCTFKSASGTQAVDYIAIGTWA